MKDGNKERNNTKKTAAKGRARGVSNRLGVFFLAVLLVFVALSVRLIFIIRDNNDSYQQRILSQQVYDSQIINAKRGEIVDCNGTVLAASKEVYNVILDVKQLLAKDKANGNETARMATVDALCSTFDVDRRTITDYIVSVPNSQYFVVKKGVSFDEMSRFLPYITKPEEGKEADSLYNKNVVGVWFEKYYVRYYPQNSLACDLIGFSLSDGQASYGLEEHYNSILTGTSGRKYGFLSDETTMEVTTIPAVDGNTLVTTIDANIQQIVEKYLKAFSDEYKDNARDGLGANNIGCIVMRANTGEILAMASYPDYNLNDPMDLSHLYTEEEIKKMEEEGTLRDAYDKLWKNFCIADTYEPGSVMKPFTVAMGLETGTIKGNESYYCGGYLTVAGHEIACHNTKGDGWLTVKGAVAQSCNVALMQMVDQIGKKNFLDYQTVFNLGLKTNIDLAGESRTDALVFNERTLNESELATSSFGQGFNVTMIQMATGYAALVNGGCYYEPHVVSKILSASGSVVKNIEPRLIKQVISAETSDTIREYCNAVVTDGTGWRARPAGYLIGGKTGTAETVPRGNGEYVVSFCAHVPADDPEIICYVVIDRPNVSKQEDAKYSSIVSKQILTEILPYLNIPMTEELTDTEKESMDELELSIFTNREEKEPVNPLEEDTSEEANQGDNTQSSADQGAGNQ
ncbi:MAG: penicillin-binding protein 2 [Lachnospiraceae bacterium]|nr:penicillin-binding protein 2 [Lachnospiraceae bacterium]